MSTASRRCSAYARKANRGASASRVGPEIAPYVAQKGSITIDGVSLTVNEVSDHEGDTHFSVNLIPHTWSVTTLGELVAGRPVNIEIDVLARYLARMKERITVP
jgi:riboflavin synthase